MNTIGYDYVESCCTNVTDICSNLANVTRIFSKLINVKEIYSNLANLICICSKSANVINTYSNLTNTISLYVLKITQSTSGFVGKQITWTLKLMINVVSRTGYGLSFKSNLRYN